MDKSEIKRANRKALPRFIFFVVIGVIIGGVLGYLLGKIRPEALTAGLKSAGVFFGAHIAPWLMMAMAVIMPIVCISIYRSCKKLLAAWDGEDEAVYSTADRKLSLVIWITSSALIISFFLIAATYSEGFAALDGDRSIVALFGGIAAFLAIMIESTVIQQKCVDTVKQLNPEKKASVYDMKFQKKWLDDCDEAEKALICKCAFKAYSATNTVCVILAIVLAVCAIVFDIGFLPSLTVCLVWLINLSAYCKEAVRY